MALSYKATNAMMPCPCCSTSSKFNYEKKTLLNTRAPLTEGIYDKTIELNAESFYACVNCGYVLGLTDDHVLNKKARNLVERTKRAAMKETSPAPSEGDTEKPGPGRKAGGTAG